LEVAGVLLELSVEAGDLEKRLLRGQSMGVLGPGADRAQLGLTDLGAVGGVRLHHVRVYTQHPYQPEVLESRGPPPRDPPKVRRNPTPPDGESDTPPVRSPARSPIRSPEPVCRIYMGAA